MSQDLQETASPPFRLKSARELVGQMTNSIHTKQAEDALSVAGYNDFKLLGTLISMAADNPEDYGFFTRNLRRDIKNSNEDVNTIFREFLNSHPASEQTKQRKQELKRLIIKPNQELSTEMQKLLQDMFPSGNYLVHGTKVESALSLAADPEGLMKSVQVIRRSDEDFKGKAGYYGISFSYNGVGALPGNWRHLTMFVTSPELGLRNNQKLTVPFYSAIKEMQLVSGNYDRELVAHMHETIDFLGFGGMLSGGVLHDRVTLEISLEKGTGNSDIETELAKIKSGEITPDKIAAKYSVVDEKFIVDLDASEGEVTEGVVFLDYLLKFSPEGRALGRSIAEITPAEARSLFEKTAYVVRNILNDIERLEKTVEGNYDVSLPISDTILFVPTTDIESWIEVFSRRDVAPRAFVAYSAVNGPKSPNWSLPEGEWDRAEELIENVVSSTDNSSPQLPYTSVIGVSAEKDLIGKTIKHLRWERVKQAKDIVLEKGKLVTKAI